MSFQEAKKLIQEARHIVLMGHKSGDADCYGSLFGLKQGLESLGKKVDIISPEDFPESLDFLFFYYTGDIARDYVQGAELLITLDSSDRSRLVAPEIFDKYKTSGTKTIQLDHHTKGDLVEITDISIIDDVACSTSEIVYHLLTNLDVTIDKNIATCLLAGIVGDTSSFQNQNTTASCFAVSSELMKKGARQKTITNNLFGGKEVDALKVWGLAMERLTVNKQFGIVSTYLLHEDISAFGYSPDVISGVVNFLNSIKGARVVMLIAEEEPGTIKVSMRTRDEHANVASIAKQLGGGGHIKAAGFSFKGSLNMLTSDGKSHIVIV